ncbi:MAG: hypothetical protein QXI91_05780 [Candidatus Bathyarchaeia archaeon]
MNKFPERIYINEEVRKAKKLINKGYKHRLRTKGSPIFKQKVKQALKLVKTAGYYDFLRKYIRCVKETDGLTQLRESEASIWANKYAVENPVDAASLLIQKANQMKEYLEGKLYYSGTAEKRLIQKRIAFLKTLKRKSRKEEVKTECERLLEVWSESALVY